MQLCRAVRYKPCPCLTHPVQLQATLMWLMYPPFRSGALSPKCGPIWCTSTSAAGERVPSGRKKKECLRKCGIRGLLHAFFLIHPSMCRWGNSSWKVEPESGFYACGEHSSECWREEVRSQAITVEEGETQNLFLWLLIITATQKKKKEKKKQNSKSLFALVSMQSLLCFYYLRRMRNADFRSFPHISFCSQS